MAIPANVALQLPPALGGVKTNPNLAVRHWPASLHQHPLEAPCQKLARLQVVRRIPLAGLQSKRTNS